MDRVLSGVLIGNAETYSPRYVLLDGRVLNNSTGAITWTGTYPIGKIDGTIPMVFPVPDPTTPSPPTPPIAAKAVQPFELTGVFDVIAHAPPASHAVAIGITNMHWVDPKFATCAVPAGSMVVRYLPPLSYNP
jgi:hypothetical protein